MPRSLRTTPKTMKRSHSKVEIAKMARSARARDDLKGAFAGEENAADYGEQVHSTSVKSRKTKKSKNRTPIK